MPDAALQAARTARLCPRWIVDTRTRANTRLRARGIVGLPLFVTELSGWPPWSSSSRPSERGLVESSCCRSSRRFKDDKFIPTSCRGTVDPAAPKATERSTAARSSSEDLSLAINRTARKLRLKFRNLSYDGFEDETRAPWPQAFHRSTPLQIYKINCYIYLNAFETSQRIGSFQ